MTLLLLTFQGLESTAKADGGVTNTITVTTLDDVVDADDGLTSLREALVAYNESGGSEFAIAFNGVASRSSAGANVLMMGWKWADAVAAGDWYFDGTDVVQNTGGTSVSGWVPGNGYGNNAIDEKSTALNVVCDVSQWQYTELVPAGSAYFDGTNSVQNTGETNVSGWMPSTWTDGALTTYEIDSAVDGRSQDFEVFTLPDVKLTIDGTLSNGRLAKISGADSRAKIPFSNYGALTFSNLAFTAGVTLSLVEGELPVLLAGSVSLDYVTGWGFLEGSGTNVEVEGILLLDSGATATVRDYYDTYTAAPENFTDRVIHNTNSTALTLGINDGQITTPAAGLALDRTSGTATPRNAAQTNLIVATGTATGFSDASFSLAWAGEGSDIPVEDVFEISEAGEAGRFHLVYKGGLTARSAAYSVCVSAREGSREADARFDLTVVRPTVELSQPAGLITDVTATATLAGVEVADFTQDIHWSFQLGSNVDTTHFMVGTNSANERELIYSKDGDLAPGAYELDVTANDGIDSVTATYSLTILATRHLDIVSIFNSITDRNHDLDVARMAPANIPAGDIDYSLHCNSITDIDQYFTVTTNADRSGYICYSAGLAVGTYDIIATATCTPSNPADGNPFTISNTYRLAVTGAGIRESIVLDPADRQMNVTHATNNLKLATVACSGFEEVPTITVSAWNVTAQSPVDDTDCFSANFEGLFVRLPSEGQALVTGEYEITVMAKNYSGQSAAVSFTLTLVDRDIDPSEPVSAFNADSNAWDTAATFNGIFQGDTVSESAHVLIFDTGVSSTETVTLTDETQGGLLIIESRSSGAGTIISNAIPGGGSILNIQGDFDLYMNGTTFNGQAGAIPAGAIVPAGAIAAELGRLRLIGDEGGFESNSGASGGAVSADSVALEGDWAFTDNLANDGNGGAIAATDATIAGANRFSGNGASGVGGAIAAQTLCLTGNDSRLICTGNQAGVVSGPSPAGIRAAGVANDIFISDRGGSNAVSLLIEGNGTYEFHGGIVTTNGGTVSIQDAASVTFGPGAINRIDGLATIGSPNVAFNNAINEFNGGIRLGAGVVQEISGDVAIGTNIVLTCDPSKTPFISGLDLANATSVTIADGATVTVVDTNGAVISSAYTDAIPDGSTNIVIDVTSGEALANLPALRFISEGNLFVLHYDPASRDYVIALPKWTDSAVIDTAWFTDVPAGTVDFTIDTAAELGGFAAIVNGVAGTAQTNFAGRTVTLTADIDLAGRNWIPVGKSDLAAADAESFAFAGTFDGGGYAVSNLVVYAEEPADTTAYAGFFGLLYGGSVIDLAIAGQVSAVASGNAWCEAGLVAAMNYGGFIDGCSAEGTVSAISTNAAHSAYAGGIVGDNYSNAVVRNCVVAHLSATAVMRGENNHHAYAGGIAGRNEVGSEIRNCRAEAVLSASNELYTAYAGGIVGCNETLAILSENVSLASAFTVSAATNWTGGIAGGRAATETNNHWTAAAGGGAAAAFGEGTSPEIEDANPVFTVATASATNAVNALNVAVLAANNVADDAILFPWVLDGTDGTPVHLDTTVYAVWLTSGDADYVMQSDGTLAVDARADWVLTGLTLNSTNVEIAAHTVQVVLPLQACANVGALAEVVATDAAGVWMFFHDTSVPDTESKLYQAGIAFTTLPVRDDIPGARFTGWTYTSEEWSNELQGNIVVTNFLSVSDIVAAVSCTYTSLWSAYTQTETTLAPVSVTDIIHYYPAAAGYTPEQIEALANTNAANVHYAVWECIYMGADPTQSGMIIDPFCVYIDSQLDIHSIPAYGLNGTGFRLWGRASMLEGDWTDLGNLDSDPDLGTNRFFHLKQAP